MRLLTEVYNSDDLTVLRDTGVQVRSLGLLLSGGGCFAVASQFAPGFSAEYAVAAIAGLTLSCASVILLFRRKTLIFEKKRRILLLNGDRIPFDRIRSVKVRLSMAADNIYLKAGAVRIALDGGRIVDLGSGSGYEASRLARRVAAAVGVEPCSELVTEYGQKVEGPVI